MKTFQHQGQLHCRQGSDESVATGDSNDTRNRQSLVSFIHKGEIIWLKKAGGHMLNNDVLREKYFLKMFHRHTHLLTEVNRLPN